MKKIFLILFILIMSFSSSNAKTIIRDTEIERYLRYYSNDIFLSAGLNPDMIKIILIQDDTPNAFVAGGMNIFIHTGLIEMCDIPEELVGVIAHETGHISGGHLARMDDELLSAKVNSLYSLLLATAIGVGTGNSDAGAAILTGGTETLKRKFLKYSRTQENVADQSAFKYLNKNDISSIGLVKFLEKLEKQSLLPSSSQAEYLRTHPLSIDRIIAAKSNLENHITKKPSLDSRKFNIIKQKIKGFNTPRKTIISYKNSSKEDELYALSIAYYKIGEKEKSLDILNSLINKENDNPYFHELKAQILRDFDDLKNAIKEYEISDNLAFSPLVKIEYARSLLDTGEDKYLDIAIKNLNQSLNFEKTNVANWQLLANAYKKADKEGLFRLSQAEADFLTYDWTKAKFNAKKSKDILKNCQRCDDIISFIDKNNEKKIRRKK